MPSKSSNGRPTKGKPFVESTLCRTIGRGVEIVLRVESLLTGHTYDGYIKVQSGAPSPSIYGMCIHAFNNNNKNVAMVPVVAEQRI